MVQKRKKGWPAVAGSSASKQLLLYTPDRIAADL